MPKKFRTASTQILEDELIKYKEVCAKNKITPFEDLKTHIMREIGESNEQRRSVKGDFGAVGPKTNGDNSETGDSTSKNDEWRLW